MKKYLLTIAISSVALCLSSCHKGSPQDRENAELTQIDTIMTDNAWVKIDPLELTLNPIGRFASDWMALATGNRKEFNSMTVSWGSIGELWNKPVIIVYVSKDRYTKKLMDMNSYFTVTGFPHTRACKNALVYLGSHSQKDEPDKTANSGLTVEFTQNGNPIFSEGNLAFECRKIYADEFEPEKMPQDVLTALYSDMGMHTMYIGEIVNVWEKK